MEQAIDPKKLWGERTVTMTDENGMNTTMLMTPANGVPYMGGMSNDWGMTPSERRRMSNRSMANNRMYNRSRTSYNNSYGNDAKMDFMAMVESLMNRAPDEHTRMKIERMLNDLR
jgi:hypothetical protein